MRDLVVGAGEVGSALGRVIHAAVRDVEPFESDRQFDTLHICFPWSDTAEAAVAGYVLEHRARIVVVHSTFPVEAFQRNPRWICSPVRGRHPNLEEGIRSFVKHVGGGTLEDRREVANTFFYRAVPVQLHDTAEELALAKLVELAQLGVEVAMEKEIHRLCSEYGVSFEEVYRTFGRSYNEGYSRLGETRFTKPILDHIPGPVGGHCVVQNAPLLDSPFFKNIVLGVEDNVRLGFWE